MKHLYILLKTISILIIFLYCYAYPIYAQLNLQSGLIACYPFSGNANDATGNGNNGTSLNGPTLVSDRFGNANSAYKFDGIDDYISVSPDNFKNNNYTYSLWTNASALPADGNNYAVWAIGNTNFSGAGDQFIMIGSNYVFTSQNGWYGGGYNSTGGVSLKAVGSLPTINTWYHLAVTRDNENVKFYVNSQLIGSAATNGDAPRYGGSGASIEARIGNRSPTLGGQNFKGIIDDISIYNRALSDLEIKALFNSNGCSPIPIPAVQDASRCGNGSLTLTASGGTQYRWYDAQTGGNLLFTGSTFTTPILSTTKVYYVSNFNGATESYRTAVTASIVPIPASPVTENVTSCGSGSVTLKATGGTSYRWYATLTSTTPVSTNSTFTTPYITAATTYYVTNYDGQCESMRKAVNIVILPIPEKPSISVNGSLIFCTGDKVILSAPNGFHSYEWSTGEKTQSIEVTSSGNFTVKVLNMSGCESVSSDPVTAVVNPSLEPSVSIFPSNTQVCTDAITTFTANPVNGGNFPQFQWKIDGVNQGNLSTNSTFTYSFAKKTQAYNAVVSVEMIPDLTCATHLSATSQIIVNVLPKLNYEVAIIPSKDEVCSGTEVIFTAHSENSNSSSIYYQWKVNDINEGVPTSSPTFKLYRINSGTVPITIKVSVELITTIPCVSTVIKPVLVYIYSPLKVFCNFPNTLDANSSNLFQIEISNGVLPYKFIWDFGNQETITTDTNSINYKYSTKGSFLARIKVVDNKGCESVCESIIKVKSPINIPPNVFTPNGDMVNERFTINYDGEGFFQMEIYNRWGKPILITHDGLSGWDGAGCTTGIYFYSIKVEDKTFKGWVSLLR